MATDHFWGYHTIIDAAGCDPEAISNKNTIAEFNATLIKEIDMVAYGEPQIVQFGVGDMIGYTLVQLIETSNINCHFVDVPRTMYLDVFSCKTYDHNIVTKLVKQFFSPKSIRTTFLIRHAHE